MAIPGVARTRPSLRPDSRPRTSTAETNTAATSTAETNTVRIPTGGTGYGESPYGATGYGGNPYGGDSYGGNPYGGNPYGGYSYGDPYGGAPQPGGVYPTDPWVNFWPGKTYPEGEPPLGQPYYGISFGRAVKRVFQKYARFDGRASRGEYWWWALAVGLFYTCFGILFGVFAGIAGASGSESGIIAVVAILGILFGLAVLALIVPNIAITVRRLHDQDLHGAFFFLTFIPLVGSLIIFVLMLMPSKHEGVRYDRSLRQ